MVIRRGEGVVQDRGDEYGDGVAWCRGSLIGKGGFGCVYLATLKNPRSKYRYLPSSMAVKSAEVSVSGSIQKEREVLSNVKGCPNIIRCFGEETTRGVNGMMAYNMLLEYTSAGTLADRIKKLGGKGLPESEVRVYARCILRGLSHIHGIGYVHCDLKPDNVLLFPSDRKGGMADFNAKIGDFGLAKREKQSKKRKLEAYWRGTPMYLSPEAVSDNVQETPSDIWALGCIVLEMLTGKPPWSGENELKVEEILTKIRVRHEYPKIPNGISKDAREFLKGCFARSSKFRWTAEMLLTHPFVDGLEDAEAIKEFQDVEDVNEIESILLVSDSETENECYLPLFSDAWGSTSEGDSFSSWSEDIQCYDDELASDFTESEFEVDGVLGGTSNTTDVSFEQPSETSPEVLPKNGAQTGAQHPVNATISAGV